MTTPPPPPGRQQDRDAAISLLLYLCVCMRASTYACIRCRVGDWLVAGPSMCRVRRLRLVDCTGEGGRVTNPSAILSGSGAANVMEVFGFSAGSLPALGSEAIVVDSEEEAKKKREVQTHTCSDGVAFSRGCSKASSACLSICIYACITTEHGCDLGLQDLSGERSTAMASAAAAEARRRGLARLQAAPREVWEGWLSFRSTGLTGR